MKKIIGWILNTKVGKSILSLIIQNFLEYLKTRAATVHGSIGVILVDFFSKLEASFISDFIDTHTVDGLHAQATGNGMTDDNQNVATETVDKQGNLVTGKKKKG